MILRPFQSNQAFVYGLLLPTIVAFYLLNGYFQHYTYNPIIELGLWGKVELENQTVSMVLAGIFISINAFQINFLFNKHEFLDRNIYAPSLFYVILMSLSQTFYDFDSLLIVHFCWLQVIRLLFLMRPGEDNRIQAFNAALFIGIASTFIPATASLFLGVWFAAWALKSFNFREWILMIFGFCFPLANAAVFWWYSGHSFGRSLLRHSKLIKYEDYIFYTTIGSVFVLFLLSLIGIQIRIRKSSIRFKKLNRTLVILLIFSLFFGVAELVFYQQVEWFTLMFIPLSFFFTFAFIHDFWKKVATTLYYLILLITVGKFFLPYAVGF
jgi:hypothetical protein